MLDNDYVFSFSKWQGVIGKVSAWEKLGKSRRCSVNYLCSVNVVLLSKIGQLETVVWFFRIRHFIHVDLVEG